MVGPDGRALDGLPELSARLARGGALDIFVLHDFTPAGLAYVRRLRELPDILRRRDPVTIIEMGFDQRHRPLLESALWPLDRIPAAQDVRPGAAWPGNRGAQIAALRPALMLAAAGLSLEERAPIRVGRPAKDDDADEGGDSE